MQAIFFPVEKLLANIMLIKSFQILFWLVIQKEAMIGNVEKYDRSKKTVKASSFWPSSADKANQSNLRPHIITENLSEMYPHKQYCLYVQL